MSCSKCGTSDLDKLVACDMCPSLECQNCVGLSTTELRCVQLKKRTLTYECENCRVKRYPINDTILQKILVNFLNGEQKLREEKLNSMITGKLKNIFQDIINEEFHPSCLKKYSLDDNQKREGEANMEQRFDMLNLELKMLKEALEEQKGKCRILEENNLLLRNKINLME